MTDDKRNYDVGRIKDIAETDAGDAPEEPDEQTKLGIKKDKEERVKNRSSIRRADDLENHLITATQRERDFLVTEIGIKNSRIASLERDLDGFSVAKEELSALKSPHSLRKAIIAGCSFFAVVGAILVSAYPQDSNGALLGLNADTLFGCGISFILVSAVISFIIGLKG